MDLENEANDRQRKHGLDGSVRLHLVPENQNQAQDWAEFHNYHLTKHETYNTNIRVDEEKLSNAKGMLGRKRGNDTEEIVILEAKIKTLEEQRKMHEVL